MRRILVSLAATTLGIALLAGPVLALSVSISPSTQSHAHGVASSWTGSWSGSPPYSVVFHYGDGTSDPLGNVTITSKGFTHTFSPCTTTQFTQDLAVSDQVHDIPFHGHSTATETGGNPC